MPKRLFLAALLPVLISGCAEYNAPSSYAGLALLLARSTQAEAAALDDFRIFLTAATTAGNTGGIGGADSICNNDVNRPSARNYKALLVDGVNRRACTTANCPGGTAEHIDWVLYANKRYFRSDGTTSLFTANDAGIFVFGNLSNAMTGTANSYYTGFSSAGDWTSSGSNCLLWANNTSGNIGRTGTGTFTNYSTLRDASNTTCDTVLKLLCVEQ